MIAHIVIIYLKKNKSSQDNLCLLFSLLGGFLRQAAKTGLRLQSSPLSCTLQGAFSSIPPKSPFCITQSGRRISASALPLTRIRYFRVSDSCQVWQKPNLLLRGTTALHGGAEVVRSCTTLDYKFGISPNLLLLNTPSIHGRFEMLYL